MQAGSEIFTGREKCNQPFAFKKNKIPNKLLLTCYKIWAYCGLTAQVNSVEFLRRECGGVAEWLKAPDCKSGRIAYTGSNPVPSTTTFRMVFCMEGLFMFERSRLALCLL